MNFLKMYLLSMSKVCHLHNLDEPKIMSLEQLAEWQLYIMYEILKK